MIFAILSTICSLFVTPPSRRKPLDRELIENVANLNYKYVK